LWATFSHDPFGGNKVVLFGLYSTSYLHGYAYLVEISEERLVQIVADYDSKMAQLTADEQILVMDLATKRYIETVEQQIHDQQMETKRSEIDAKDAEFDAKFDALESDRLAILTKREQLAQAIQKAQSQIQILEAKIAEEEISSEYVDVEIAKKELEAAQAQLRVLEAGVRGLQIQYDIANTAVQKTELEAEKHETKQKLDLVPAALEELNATIKNLEADKIRTDAAKEMIDVDITELEIRKTKAEIDEESRGVDTALLDVDIAKAYLDKAMVDVEIVETQARTAREIAKRIGLETDTAMVEVQLAQIQLDVDRIAVQLKEIEADIATMDARLLRKDLLELEQDITEVRKSNMEYEIPEKRDAQIAAIEKQIEVLQYKIDAEEAFLSLEDTHQASRETLQQTQHDHRMTMTALEDDYRLHRAQVKLESFAKDILLAEVERLSQAVQDQEQIKVPESQVQASYKNTSAAEDAAEIMASANIVNTLTHVIGSS
jgi:hypothetical protein